MVNFLTTLLMNEISLALPRRSSQSSLFTSKSHVTFIHNCLLFFSLFRPPRTHTTTHSGTLCLPYSVYTKNIFISPPLGYARHTHILLCIRFDWINLEIVTVAGVASNCSDVEKLCAPTYPTYV